MTQTQRGGPAQQRGTGGAGTPGDTGGPTDRVPMRTWIGLLLILLLNYMLVRLFLPQPGAPHPVPYTLFKEQAAAGNVVEIYSRGERITGRFEQPVVYPPETDTVSGTEPDTVTTFSTTLPAFVDPGLEALLIANGVVIRADPIEEEGSWITLLYGFGPALLLILFYVWIFRRASKAAGGLGGLGGMGMFGMGKSQPRRVDQETGQRVTFDDVAGIDEAENELVEIVDF